MIPCGECIRLKHKLRLATFAETAAETNLYSSSSGSTVEFVKQSASKAKATEDYIIALETMSEHQATHR
jgi:hypothetical protein